MLLLALAACTQHAAGLFDEGADGVPMIFTATGLEPVAATAGSRSPVDGDWQGVSSVAVMMNDEVKAYDVTASAADGYASATLSSDDPHLWRAGMTKVTVSAWFPYNDGEEGIPAVKVKADQSEWAAFAASDLIVADQQEVTYDAPTLTFTHCTALIHIILRDCPDGLESVLLTGLSGGATTRGRSYRT